VIQLHPEDPCNLWRFAIEFDFQDLLQRLLDIARDGHGDETVKTSLKNIANHLQTRGQCYKTFNGRNLIRARAFVHSMGGSWP
jgi:hypothetical protein